MSNVQPTKWTPTQLQFDRIGRDVFREMDSRRLRLDILPDFSAERVNSVRDLRQRYDKMNVRSDLNRSFDSVYRFGRSHVSSNDKIKCVRERRLDSVGLQRTGSTTAFQIASAKYRGFMNQIEPNIVKKRISEYNELQSTSSVRYKAPHPSPTDRRFMKDLRSIIKENDTEVGLNYSSEDDDFLRVFGNNVRNIKMYEKHVKNGKKKVSKKVQLQTDHHQLVKFYRKLFCKISQIPFAVAVIYCILFFIIQAISVVQTFVYSS